jgi:hypothetical protein
MHLPAASPPMRGFFLILISRLSSLTWIRNLLLAKMRRDIGIARMPDPQ